MAAVHCGLALGRTPDLGCGCRGPRPAAPVLIKSKASAAVSNEPEAPAKVFMRTAGTAHFGNCPFACASGFLCVVGAAVVAALGSASQRCRE